jgi:sarcosine oxidase subunit beta
MALPTTADYVIIGGGVMGVSTAYHLAKRGAKNIVVLEKAEFFGIGSTGRCAGGIRHQFSTDVNIELSKLSIGMLERFEQETGQAVDLKQNGYLFMLSTESEVEVFKRNVAKQHEHGVMTEWLTHDEIAKRVPQFNLEGIIGGTYYSKDGIADPSGVVNGYVAAGKPLGVQYFTEIEVTGLEASQDKITGVITKQGRIATPNAILTAGAWSAPLSATLGITLPIVPERQQVLVTKPIPTLPPDFPFVIDFHDRLYFHLEGGGLLTGQGIHGGASTFDQSVDEEWSFQHMEKAMARLPLLETAAPLTEWAGLYEVTPDAHPIMDHIPEVNGFYVCAGFSGHGFMHGTGAGLLMAELIADGQASTLDISTLNLARFSGDQVYREFNVI